MKTGILLVNLGTPDSPSVSDVKKYLTEFLMDGRVIDIPYIKRTLLVKGIIVPFRSVKVAREYKKLWMDEGSPLLVYGKSLALKLKNRFNQQGTKTSVQLAMRYQNPSIEKALNNLRKQNVDKIIVFPLFPQYASATTGSVAEEVMRLVSQWTVIPSIEMINYYHDKKEYIDAFAEKTGNDILKLKPDHVLFSYHGIPERHLYNIQKENNKQCGFPACECQIKAKNKPYCYRSACFRTSELIAAKLGISNFSTSFQSRLGKDPWIQPYTDESIIGLTKMGIKKLLVVSPSFVADCLETTLEIGEEYRELFLEHGGEQFNYTESLNDSEIWVEGVYQMLMERL
ncbi:ferrochelatase [Robertkochia solimangrovi]|uniref:ferrochelatase n=1 Tax=Robertkochia solimangrovi TaxID=2213046 RepID=UPI00117D77A9|nr:ferrochelatase [Robertkochia solimangrovi]TRZ42933.1 ferrochelatase [Robertkochia solimangrovi]